MYAIWLFLNLCENINNFISGKFFRENNQKYISKKTVIELEWFFRSNIYLKSLVCRI